MEVYNKFALGSRRMGEDRPLQLFNSPSICRSSDCVADPTRYYTGNLIDHVICQQQGDWVTNENTTTTSDDRNPGRFASRTWYGVRLDENRLGFFSVTWARPSQRGGLHPPDCRSHSVKGG